MAELPAEALLGTWVLERFLITFPDGRDPVFPFGQSALGQLIYTADGHMSAVLSREDREPLTTRRLETAHKSPDHEKATAFESYLSYAGRWRLDGDEVVHEVELALVPNIEGAHQRRRVQLADGRLVLSYEVVGSRGLPRHYELTWRRPA